MSFDVPRRVSQSSMDRHLLATVIGKTYKPLMDYAELTSPSYLSCLSRDFFVCKQAVVTTFRKYVFAKAMVAKRWHAKNSKRRRFAKRDFFRKPWYRSWRYVHGCEYTREWIMFGGSFVVTLAKLRIQKGIAARVRRDIYCRRWSS